MTFSLYSISPWITEKGVQRSSESEIDKGTPIPSFQKIMYVKYQQDKTRVEEQRKTTNRNILIIISLTAKSYNLSLCLLLNAEVCIYQIYII